MTDDQPLIERQNSAKTISARFRAMADLIDRNADTLFGGAAVIVPPNGGGEPIEIFVLDSKGNVGQFWSAIKTRATTAVTDLDNQQQRLHQGFGQR